MLKYKALWIDDSTESRDAKIEGIGEFLIEEGFAFKPIPKEDAEDIEKHLNDPELDIIITDFNGINVEKLIKKVHSLPKYIDLVLYSENPPPEFYEVARSVPGIYPCTREDVEDTIKKVIQSTIRRTQNVTNMRGIIISEAIDIENQIEDIILSYYDTREKELAKVLLSGDGCNELGPKIRFLNSMLKGIIASIKSSDQAAEKEMQQEIELLFSTAKKLENEVCKPRDMLAHVEHTIENNTVFLKSLKTGYENIKIDSARCKEMRKSFMKHASNLNQIKDFLSKWHENKKQEKKE